MITKCQLILSLFLTALLSSAITNAVPDSTVTGSYKVSFDLGLPHDAYIVQEVAPVTDETLGGDRKTTYSVMIANKTGSNRFIQVNVVKASTSAPLVASAGELFKAVLVSKDSSDPRISNFESDTRIIDGEEGAVSSFVTEMPPFGYVTAYRAMYMPPFYNRDTIIHIISTFPWNEGTLQLLKTIHIEEIE